MKILVYSFFHPAGSDGATVSGRALIGELRRLGHQVQIVTTDILWSPEQIRNNQERELQIFPCLSSSPLEISPQLLKYFSKQMTNFDVVWFRGIFSLGMVYGAWRAHRLGIPYVVSPLGNCAPRLSSSGTVHQGFFKWLFFKLALQKRLRQAARIICASSSEAENLCAFTKLDNLAVIPNGVAAKEYSDAVLGTELQAPGLKADQPFFLALGRFSPEKSLEFLLELWPEILRRCPDCKLVLAGNDVGHEGYADLIRSRIQNLGLERHVLLAGSVSGNVKLALLQHAKALLFPSRRESFGNVVLESLAAGTPVVAGHGTPWQVLDQVGLGRWLDLDSAKWIEVILSYAQVSVPAREDFRLRSRAWVGENFSWQSSAQRYSELFQTVAAKADRP